MQFVPDRLHGLRLVAVEVAAANPNELPSRPLEVALSGHVVLVALGSVPFVAIALHRESPLHALHDQVDPVTVVGRVANADLGSDVETPLGEPPNTSRSKSESKCCSPSSVVWRAGSSM